MVRRGVPTKNLTPGEVERAANDTVQRVITPAAGHPDRGRQGHRAVPQGPQDEEGAGGDHGRPGPGLLASKDELQEAMRVLREHDFGVALQFGNYRS